MTERLEQELAMLKGRYPDLEFRADGLWVRLPAYPLPSGVWNLERVEIAFQIPALLPGQEPYGFYVRPPLTLADGTVPNNCTDDPAPPFGVGWSKFSWSPDPWVPTDDPATGSNMVLFAQSFAARFLQGA